MGNLLISTFFISICYTIYIYCGLVPIEPSNPYKLSPQGPFPVSPKQWDSQHKFLILFFSETIINHFTQFIDTLEEAGYSCEIQVYTDKFFPNLLENYEPLYGGIILFDHGRPNDEKFMSQILEYIEFGGSFILFSGRTNLSPLSLDIAKNIGISFRSPNQITSLLNDSNTLKFQVNTDSPIVKYNGTLIYQGFGIKIESENPLLHNILSAPIGSIYKKQDKPAGCGGKTSLVSAIIARNGSRVILCGSAKVVTNSIFDENPGNKDFFKQIVDWSMKNKGLISASNLKHYKVSDPMSTDQYTWNDEIYVSIDLHELKDGYWHPMKTQNLQMEMFMLHPFIRKFLDAPSNETSPTYHTSFIAPDKHGIFKIVIRHQTYGYNPIYIESLAPIRVYRIDEYPRFIVGAYPFYASAISSLLGTFFFVIFFLYHVDIKPHKE